MGGKILGNSGHMNNPDLSLGGGKGRGEEGKRKKKSQEKSRRFGPFGGFQSYVHSCRGLGVSEH